MKILHTSDWHLGRSFGEHSLERVQAAFVDWIVELTAAEQIDLVVIAGDLHDRSVPSADAVTLLSDALRRLRSTGARVAAISGNHDSAARIAAFDGLVDAGGIVLRGGYGAASRVETLEFADGPLALVATPFLDPLLAPDSYREPPSGEDDEKGPTRRLTHEAVLGRALAAARADVPEGRRSLVLSHAFVTGAAPSDSERDLSVGDAGMVSASVFDGFSYVALGHLHRPQAVGGRPNVRYSGSPLAYSFSEDHPKEVVIVDLAADGTVRTEAIAVGVGHRVRTVRGTIDDLLELPPDTESWIRAELTDPVPVIDAHRRLRDHFPLLVELARVARLDAPGAALHATEAQTRTPAELADTFWAEVTGDAPPPAVTELLATVLADATDQVQA